MVSTHFRARTEELQIELKPYQRVPPAHPFDCKSQFKARARCLSVYDLDHGSLDCCTPDGVSLQALLAVSWLPIENSERAYTKGAQWQTDVQMSRTYTNRNIQSHPTVNKRRCKMQGEFNYKDCSLQHAFGSLFTLPMSAEGEWISKPLMQ